MLVGKRVVRLPKAKHEWAEKGEHLFHSSYLAAESLVGHGVLQWLALGTLLAVILGVLLHEH